MNLMHGESLSLCFSPGYVVSAGQLESVPRNMSPQIGSMSVGTRPILSDTGAEVKLSLFNGPSW